VNPIASANAVDVIIIGAGINGAGIARDAALRGLKVLLLDKSDLASGTTSASTRLIHGGLRYLEHFEFGLVRESLREREILLRIAPHLVRPLPITVPIYKQSKRGPATIRAGMIAYDLLSLTKSLPRHNMLSRAKTLKRLPGLNPEALLGAAVYFDAQIEFAERLVLENILAAQALDAQVCTYTRVAKVLSEGTGVSGVKFVTEDGTTHFSQASVIINAAGPWIDQLLKGASIESPKLIDGTKGSHVVVPAFSGAPANAVYVEARSDGRPFFIIPWNGNYLIGTTDVRFQDDPDQVRSELWEIDYLLAETNFVFPGACLIREHVLYTYSGVRPLPVTGDTHEQNITRRHFIREHPQLKNLFSIVGGKLTTYRSLAEECVDLIFRKLGRSSPPCMTAKEVLPGAAGFPSFAASFIKEERFAPAIRERLLRVYGSRAAEVVQLNNDLSKPLSKTALAAEIVFAFECESAKTLADCLLRRTMIGLNGDLGLNDADAAAEIGKRFLGWSEWRAKREVENYREEVKRFMPAIASAPVNHEQIASEACAPTES
jgi:glycerol-3-phosphate dehydrogenase